jgi:hypothetical protein
MYLKSFFFDRVKYFPSYLTTKDLAEVGTFGVGRMGTVKLFLDDSLGFSLQCGK